VAAISFTVLSGPSFAQGDVSASLLCEWKAVRDFDTSLPAMTAFPFLARSPVDVATDVNRGLAVYLLTSGDSSFPNAAEQSLIRVFAVDSDGQLSHLSDMPVYGYRTAVKVVGETAAVVGVSGLVTFVDLTDPNTPVADFGDRRRAPDRIQRGGRRPPGVCDLRPLRRPARSDRRCQPERSEFADD
jgi:hypothetical protein